MPIEASRPGKARVIIAGGRRSARPLAASFDVAREIGMMVNPGTMHGYRRRVRQFDAWCDARTLPAYPTSDEALAIYLSELASAYHVHTLHGIVSAVVFANRVAGRAFTPRLSRKVLSGIARLHGAGSETRAPIDGRDLERFAASCGDCPAGRRDKALLLLGFSAALGSNDIVGIDLAGRGPDACGQVTISPSGMRIEIIKPASMQSDARMVVKFVPRRSGLCPVAAVERWLAGARITGGPLLRRIDRWGHIGEGRLLAKSAPAIVRRIVLRAELAAGASPAEALRSAGRYAMTSLRSGFIVCALESGSSEERVATHLGYTSTQALRHFRRRHITFSDHPARAVLRKAAGSGCA